MGLTRYIDIESRVATRRRRLTCSKRYTGRGVSRFMSTILIASAAHDATARELLERDVSWSVVEARSSEEAFARLELEPVSLCLTDAELPDATPERFLGELRYRYPRLPVVLLARSSNESVVRALRFGAASYVPRSSVARDLVTTVSRVLELCEAREGESRALGWRVRASASFELENDPETFRPLAVHWMHELGRFGLAAGNEGVYAGIALEEALLNAMIHGNLEVGSDARERGYPAYDALVEQRRHESPYRERRIRVDLAFDADEALATVRDEGAGFDVASIPDPKLPENLTKVSGRGVLLMRSFMDEVRFGERGNQVTLVKRRPSSKSS